MTHQVLMNELHGNEKDLLENGPKNRSWGKNGFLKLIGIQNFLVKKFGYNPETKRHSMQWHTSGFRMSKSKIKSMLCLSGSSPQGVYASRADRHSTFLPRSSRDQTSITIGSCIMTICLVTQQFPSTSFWPTKTLLGLLSILTHPS